jgi:hypothetical protein
VAPAGETIAGRFHVRLTDRPAARMLYQLFDSGARFTSSDRRFQAIAP